MDCIICNKRTIKPAAERLDAMGGILFRCRSCWARDVALVGLKPLVQDYQQEGWTVSSDLIPSTQQKNKETTRMTTTTTESAVCAKCKQTAKGTVHTTPKGKTYHASCWKELMDVLAKARKAIPTGPRQPAAPKEPKAVKAPVGNAVANKTTNLLQAAENLMEALWGTTVSTAVNDATQRLKEAVEAFDIEPNATSRLQSLAKDLAAQQAAKAVKASRVEEGSNSKADSKAPKRLEAQSEAPKPAQDPANPLGVDGKPLFKNGMGAAALPGKAAMEAAVARRKANNAGAAQVAPAAQETVLEPSAPAIVSRRDVVPGTSIPKPKVQLSGQDGNAFALLSRVQQGLRRAVVPQAIQDAYRTKATSGNYDNLLATSMEYVSDSGEDFQDDSKE